jgi:hypothetical protein
VWREPMCCPREKRMSRYKKSCIRSTRGAVGRTESPIVGDIPTTQHGYRRRVGIFPALRLVAGAGIALQTLPPIPDCRIRGLVPLVRRRGTEANGSPGTSLRSGRFRCAPGVLAHQ